MVDLSAELYIKLLNPPPIKLQLPIIQLVLPPPTTPESPSITLPVPLPINPSLWLISKIFLQPDPIKPLQPHALLQQPAPIAFSQQEDVFN